MTQELLVQIKADTTKAQKGIEDLNEQIKKLTESNKKFGATAKDTDKVTTSYKGMVKPLAGIASAFGAIGLATSAIDLSKLAADAEQSADAFERVFTDMGLVAEEEFEKIREASKGLISEADIKQSAVTAASLGVPIKKLAELMEVARAKSREMGTDTSKAFEDLATGIGRGSPMILDNLGLTIKLGEANEKYAKSLGITVEEMSKSQKQMALTNAVIDAGAKSVKRYSDAALSSKEKTAKMNASIDDLKVSIGTKLLPVMDSLVESVTEYVDSIEDADLEAFKIGIDLIAGSVSVLWDALKLLNDLAMPDILTEEGAGALDTTAKALNNIGTHLTSITKTLNAMAKTSEAALAIDDVEELAKSYDGLATSYDTIETKTKQLIAENLKLRKVFRNNGSDEAKAQLKELDEQYQRLVDVYKVIGSDRPFDESTESAKESTKAVETLSKAQQKALEKINKIRIKDAGKTLKTLAKNEEKLTKDILKLNQDLVNDLKDIENDRLSSRVDIQSQIRELERGGLDERAAYYEKEKDADKLLSDARRALMEGDLEAYKTYADEYKSLVQSTGDSAIEKDGKIIISSDTVRENSIQNLKDLGALEEEFYNKKAEAAQADHDQKVAFATVQIDLIKLNIEAQKELILLASTPITPTTDTTAIDNIVAKIDGLKNGLISLQNTPVVVSTNTASIDNAKQKVEELRTLTINGVELEVDADTTPADFGISKLITTVGEESVDLEINPKYEEAEKELDDFRKDEESDPVDVELEPHTEKLESETAKAKEPIEKDVGFKPDTKAVDAASKAIAKPIIVPVTYVPTNSPPAGSAGFAHGGFTGSGSNSEVAGVVHKNEFVIPAYATKAIGVGNLYKMISNLGLKGYQSGGLVTASRVPINLNVGGKTFSMQSDEAVADSITRFIASQGGM